MLERLFDLTQLVFSGLPLFRVGNSTVVQRLAGSSYTIHSALSPREANPQTQHALGEILRLQKIQ